MTTARALVCAGCGAVRYGLETPRCGVCGRRNCWRAAQVTPAVSPPGGARADETKRSEAPSNVRRVDFRPKAVPLELELVAATETKESAQVLELVTGIPPVTTAHELELVSIDDMEIEPIERVSSGLAWFDRVVGGGWPVAHVVIVAGAKGLGKSTMLLQALQECGADFVAAEESLQDVGRRIIRVTNVRPSRIHYVRATSWQEYVTVARRSKKPVTVLDSFQGAVGGNLGAQLAAIREAYDLARELRQCMVLTSQMSAAGRVRGSEEIQQLCDVIARVDGDGKGSIVLSMEKNRADAPTHERANLRHTGQGLREELPEGVPTP